MNKISTFVVADDHNQIWCKNKNCIYIFSIQSKNLFS